MNLGFSTHWGERMGELAGSPTFFVEKIWYSFCCFEDDTKGWIHPIGEQIEAWSKLLDVDERFNFKPVRKPKEHTIRRDEKDRWEVGSLIHFIIGSRTKDRFQFAPVLKVKTIQRITISRPFKLSVPLGKMWAHITVDGRLLNEEEMNELAVNDGFTDLQEFFLWFNERFEGKIISWTGKTY